MTEKARLWILAAVLVLVAAVVRIPWATAGNFHGDSADYVNSARSFPTLYLDTESKSAVEYWQFFKYASANNIRPWNALYRQNDNAALRHFHVPAAFYPIAIARGLNLGNQAIRGFYILLGILLPLVAFWSLRSMDVDRTTAFLAGLMLALDTGLHVVFYDPNPHSLYLLLIFLMFAAIRHEVVEATPRWVRWTPLVAAAALLSFELGVPLIIAWFGSLAWWKFREFGKHTRFILRSLLATLGFAFLLWPAGIFKGSLAVAYGGIFYQGSKGSTYYGRLSIPRLVEAIYPEHVLTALLLPLLVVSIAVLVRWGQLFADTQQSRVFRSVAMYSCAALLFSVGSRFRNETYVAESMVPFLITAALVPGISRVPTLATRGLQAVLLIAIVWEANENRWVRPVHDPWRTVIARLQENGLNAGEAIMTNDSNDGAMLKLYLPSNPLALTTGGDRLELRDPLEASRVGCALINLKRLGPKGSVLTEYGMREIGVVDHIEGPRQLACRP